MKLKFDFFIHWVYAIVFAILMISGFSMVSAKHGWLLNFDFALADYIHRLFAAIFVVITAVSILFEIYQNIGSNEKRVWFQFGRSGYPLFTFTITLLLIISGALIWLCMEFNMIAVSFAVVVHEYISYVALAGVIWHIYKKCHALLPLSTQQKRLTIDDKAGAK